MPLIFILLQEEITRLKKQYEEVVREKKCLKQQCTEAIMQWDTALRDKNRLQEEAIKVIKLFRNFVVKFDLSWFSFLILSLLLQLREKNEELLKEMNTQMAESQNLNKEFKRLQVFIIIFWLLFLIRFWESCFRITHFFHFSCRVREMLLCKNTHW